MKIFSKNTLILYILVILYTFIGIVLQINNQMSYYNTIINPIIWLLIFGFAVYTSYSEKKRLKAKTEKTQTVLIITMIYLCIYFILGMFFGYVRSPYSHQFLPFLKNLWAFVSIIFFQEYIRATMCPSGKLKWYWYLLVTIVFTLSEINFYHFSSNFIDLETTFEYICSIILPIVARNCLFTYLAVVGGYGCNLCYRVPIMVAYLVMPLFPDLEWFWVALLELLLVLIVFIEINYIHEKKTSRSPRQKIRKQKLIRKIPLLTIVVLFVCFVAGVFQYMPVAIMSNSMAHLINRGDVVVIFKLNDQEKKDLKVNDIIEYHLDGSSVVHRIIKVNKVSDNEVYYITKGDYNQNEDLLPVSYDQVAGKVLICVPKIGYPAVLLNELFNQDKPDVEMG